MNISAAASLAFSQPIAEHAGWQGALGCTVIFGLLTMIAWIPILRSEHVEQGKTEKEDKLGKDLEVPSRLGNCNGDGNPVFIVLLLHCLDTRNLVSQGFV